MHCHNYPALIATRRRNRCLNARFTVHTATNVARTSINRHNLGQRWRLSWGHHRLAILYCKLGMGCMWLKSSAHISNWVNCGGAFKNNAAPDKSLASGMSGDASWFNTRPTQIQRTPIVRTHLGTTPVAQHLSSPRWYRTWLKHRAPKHTSITPATAHATWHQLPQKRQRQFQTHANTIPVATATTASAATTSTATASNLHMYAHLLRDTACDVLITNVGRRDCSNLCGASGTMATHRN